MNDARQIREPKLLARTESYDQIPAGDMYKYR
jgi:hypothetical protein